MKQGFVSFKDLAYIEGPVSLSKQRRQPLKTKKTKKKLEQRNYYEDTSSEEG
jgi:hypothetical protein